MELNGFQRVGVGFVVLLGVAVFVCLMGYNLWAGEVVEDVDKLPYVPGVTATPKPTATFNPDATPYIPVKKIHVEGETSFTFNCVGGVKVIEKAYIVSNIGDLAVAVSAKAVSTDGVTQSVSWDKTSAVLEVGESVLFKLALLVSGNGACTVSFYKT